LNQKIKQTTKLKTTIITVMCYDYKLPRDMTVT